MYMNTMLDYQEADDAFLQPSRYMSLGLSGSITKALVHLNPCLPPAQLEFMRPLTACMLSERRSVRPFGLKGGGSGAPGLNLIVRKGGHTVNLGAKNFALFQARRYSLQYALL